ncbi:hypothetical protein D9M70_485730 [compost metagenome]
MLAGNVEQQTVVVGSVCDDVATEVENRQIQQTFLDQVQGVENTSCPAITVGERVNGLELVMPDGHAYQRIQVSLVVQKTLPVGE